ncbi:MAG: hypothetical protein KJO03_01420, partial [Gammaproteobacteria bacterium]|nr:hypothetical protein [Gammaproteobacteria bacterium]
DAQGKVVWYMGGQLAEDGVNKTDIALVKAAKKELSELIPWLDLNGAEWGVLEINRAEIKKPGTTRPDTFSIEQHGDVITAWPTKLALAPVLADELVDMLQADNVEKSTDQALPEWAPPVYAELPWDEDPCWLPPSEVDV